MARGRVGARGDAEDGLTRSREEREEVGNRELTRIDAKERGELVGRFWVLDSASGIMRGDFFQR